MANSPGIALHLRRGPTSRATVLTRSRSRSRDRDRSVTAPTKWNVPPWAARRYDRGRVWALYGFTVHIHTKIVARRQGSDARPCGQRDTTTTSHQPAHHQPPRISAVCVDACVKLSEKCESSSSHAAVSHTSQQTLLYRAQDLRIAHAPHAECSETVSRLRLGPKLCGGALERGLVLPRMVVVPLSNTRTSCVGQCQSHTNLSITTSTLLAGCGGVKFLYLQCVKSISSITR